MEKLFLTVLRMGMTTSYLILAVIIARFLLKKAPKNMICLLWIVVGLRLLCPFHIETAFSLLPEQTNSFASQVSANAPVTHENTIPETSILPDTDPQPAAATKTVAKNVSPAKNAKNAATWIWLAGCVAMLTYLAFSWHQIRKHVSEAVPATSENIRFYQCDHISSPFLFGLAVPKIYVPFSVSGQELFYILKHEQAHKNRYDHLAKTAGYLLLSIYWFQPLVWAAYLLFCRDIELACDENVVAEIGEDCKKAYSQALLSYSIKNKAAVVYPVAFGEIGVKKRVKNILNYKKPGRLVITIAATMCVIITFCFATEAKSKNTPQTKLKTEHTQKVSTANTATSVQKNQTAITKCVKKWVKAFCGRDGKTIYGMLDNTGRKQMDMLDGEYSFGWSSPWPWDPGLIDDQPNYRILSVNETSAEILYYAWTSDPHVTVWHQIIRYKYSDKENKLRIHDTPLEILDSIHTAKQFFTAYPNGEIDGTRMDYFHGNKAGEALNANASLYEDSLCQPDTAALILLNIQDDPSKVKTNVVEQNGETMVTFTFLEDDSTASVKMVQPEGKDGIWVPQTLS